MKTLITALTAFVIFLLLAGMEVVQAQVTDWHINFASNPIPGVPYPTTDNVTITQSSPGWNSNYAYIFTFEPNGTGYALAYKNTFDITLPNESPNGAGIASFYIKVKKNSGFAATGNGEIVFGLRSNGQWLWSGVVTLNNVDTTSWKTVSAYFINPPVFDVLTEMAIGFNYYANSCSYYLDQLELKTVGGAIIPIDGFGENPVGIFDDPFTTPTEITLAQNYPNPFNPETIIEFYLPAPTIATLTVYNPIGQEVAVLVDNKKLVGAHEINFNARNLPSGFYFYKLITADGFVQTKKMILLK